MAHNRVELVKTKVSIIAIVNSKVQEEWLGQGSYLVTEDGRTIQGVQTMVIEDGARKGDFGKNIYSGHDNGVESHKKMKNYQSSHKLIAILSI